ncbi:MAG: ATP-binding protein [Bacteroidota bacterium]
MNDSIIPLSNFLKKVSLIRKRLTNDQHGIFALLIFYPALHMTIRYIGEWRGVEYVVPSVLIPCYLLSMAILLYLSFHKTNNKNSSPYLGFVGVQIYMSIIILLSYLNGNEELFVFFFWGSLLVFCNYFEHRKHLVMFLVTNFVLCGASVLISQNDPLPDFLFFIWYPLASLAVYLFVGAKISDQEQLYENTGILKESEEMFKLVFEEANYGIVITNREKKVIRVNKAMCAMFKYSEQELLTMDSHDLTYPEDQDLTFQLFDNANIKGKDQYTTEKRYICKDGEVIDCNVSVRIIRDLENRHILNIGLIENITERKKDEAKIKEYARKLQQSNKDLEDFSYVVSHDLREPLRMITSYLQLLDKRFSDELGPTATEYINFATDGARRMNKLILDLLQYSRVGRENVKKWVDLNRVIEMSIRNLKLKIFENDAVVEYNDLPTLMANEIQLVLLFQNLIQNAIKYKKPGVPPRVKISARHEKDFWEIIVEDNGIGIEKSFLEHIFIIFYQAKPDDPNSSGSGIGLAICQKIVKLHQGKIYVDSTYGKGTNFNISLPYQRYIKEAKSKVSKEQKVDA